MNENFAEIPVDSSPPKTWLIESILVAVFCCLPFGIVGIVNASRVESRFYAGNPMGAVRASKEAKRFTMIAFFTGLVIGMASLIFNFVVGFGFDF